MVLHKATAAAGHVVRPVLEPLAKKSICKVAPPPKVKKRWQEGRSKVVLRLAMKPLFCAKNLMTSKMIEAQSLISKGMFGKKLLKLPIGHEGSPPPEVREKIRKCSNTEDSCGDCEPFCS